MKKFTTADRLKQIMAERGLRQVDILDLVKPYSIQYQARMGKSALSQYISGGIEPKQDKLGLLAMALNVNEAWLMGYDVPNTRVIRAPGVDYKNYTLPNGDYVGPKCEPMPILGRIAAGYDSTALEEETGEYIFLPSDMFKNRTAEDFFVLCVSGDSMFPEIHDGDLAVVRRVSSVDPGRIAVVLYNNDEATLKKVNYVYGQDWMDLIPINPQFPPKKITGSALEQCKILGELKYLIREY